MKRIIALVLVILTMCALFAACKKSSKSSTFTCDNCSEEVTGHKNTATLEGETIEYCDDCADQVDAVLELYEMYKDYM